MGCEQAGLLSLRYVLTIQVAAIKIPESFFVIFCDLRIAQKMDEGFCCICLMNCSPCYSLSGRDIMEVLTELLFRIQSNVISSNAE